MKLKMFYNKILGDSKSLQLAKIGQYYLYKNNFSNEKDVKYRDHECIFIKDLDNNKIVGVVAYIIGDSCWLTLIYILKSYRQFGLFKIMLRHLAKIADDNNVLLRWGVNRKNKLALYVYNKIGAKFEKKFSNPHNEEFYKDMLIYYIEPYKLL